MIRNRLALPVVIVVILAIVGVITATSGGSTKAAQPAASAISVAQTQVGKALVDANGRTLYLFAADKPDVSRLSNAGKAIWPPFTSATPPIATGGASAAHIGMISSSKQITYNGHPLYYYAGDHQSGQIAGQGLSEFGARWYVLSAAGAAITASAPSGSASQSGSNSTGGGASYGY